MAVALYNISFKESFDRKVLCTTSLNRAELEHLQEAIEDLYYFEFVYGMLGSVSGECQWR